MRLGVTMGTDIYLSYERNLKLIDALFSNITNFFSHIYCVS